MKAVTSTLGTIVVAVFLLALLLVITLLAGAGIVLVGRILTLVGDLTTFQASLIALGTAFGLVVALNIVTRPTPPPLPEWMSDNYDDEEDYDEDYDEEDEDAEVKIVPPRSRNDPCPCGSGKKYKYCHGQSA